MRTVAYSASAYFAMFVSDSATTKYATASTDVGIRPSGTFSISTGTGARPASASSAAGELAQLLQRARQLDARPLEDPLRDVGVGPQLALGQAELQRERDEPLL